MRNATWWAAAVMGMLVAAAPGRPAGAAADAADGRKGQAERREAGVVVPLVVELDRERLMTKYWQGRNLAVEPDTPEAAAEALGPAAGAAASKGVDFATHRVVLVMRLGGDGTTFGHEFKAGGGGGGAGGAGAAGKRRVVFFVQGPKGGGPRTDIALHGVDVYAVAWDVAVEVEAKPRR